MNSNCGESIVSGDYIDLILDFDIATREEFAGVDICSIEIDSTFTAVYIPFASAPSRVLDMFGYKDLVRLFGLMDTQSLEASGVTRLRNVPRLDLRGQGVLIGIVDTGIDYTHRAFINADGTSKILSIWDQSIQSNNPPEGLYYGTEYTREQINEALQSSDPRSIVPSIDEVGHGTFLAGVAAGNEDIENGFSGVAPDAELVVVKLKPPKQYIREFFLVPPEAVCFQENDIMLGIKYLLNTAARFNRPISICIGLGTSQGSHDELDTLSSFLTAISLIEGVSVTVAAGNEGNSRHHYENTLLPGTDNDSVEINVGPNVAGLYFEIWGEIPNTFGIDLTSPGGEFIPMIVPRINERREISFIFETTIINLYFQLVGLRSGAQLVIMRFQNPTEGIWRIGIHKIDRTIPLTINIWLPITNFMESESFFIRSSPYITLTSPGNSYIPMVITAYVPTNDSLYINASRGFTRTGFISPDLAAPGVNILGPSPGNNYVTMTGTSVSAAHTAGITAMLMEWALVRGAIEHLDGVDVKNLLIRGAQRDPVRLYPNREWGYGIVDVYGTFERLRGNP